MGAKQKNRKARDPFYSVDARDTETREVPANTEKPDLTVGLTVTNEYEVESIEDRMFYDEEFYYLIKWKGWASEHNSWEPKSGLTNSRLLIKRFEKSYPELLQARFLRISEQLPLLEPLGGKATLYECEVVAGMTIEDYNTIYKLPKEEEPLPNPKLLRAYINKVLQNKGNDNLLAMIKRMVLKREQIRIQFEQQAFMKNFITKLNEVGGNELLSIENNVDLGFPPLSFQPISKNVPHEEIEIPEDPPVGCACDTCDHKSQCCPQLADVNFAYNSRGLLEINYGNPIFECNKACKCPDSCLNRVVQKGSQLKLKIFKTEDKGWGVQAREYIPQGAYVCEYVGEMIARWVVHQRMKDEYKGKPNYIFDLDFNPITEEERFDAEGYEILPYSIDATVRGNVSHFINHSCEPNIGVYGVYVDCLDPHMPRLGMFAIRDIQCGDEIFFDYTAQYLLKRRKKGPKAKRSGSSMFTCKCGSSFDFRHRVIPSCYDGHDPFFSLRLPRVRNLLFCKLILSQHQRLEHSIEFGYANAKIFKCNNEKCPRPACYTSGGSAKENSFPCQRLNCTGHYELLRHVSFVDCPGHDILMATMLSGAAVMDAALLLIAGNEPCPQPQTKEHLAAVEIMKLNNIIILQNKIDLVKEGQATEQYQEVLKFVQGTVAEGAPVIPISAQLKYNIEVLCEYIVKKVPVPERDLTSAPRLIIIRSFDVNKPGCEAAELKGGVAGGSILRGMLKVGMEVEVRPGIVSKDSKGETTCKPIFTRIVSLCAEQNKLDFAVPGGLIGVGTKIDPTLCRADRLVGQVLGAVGTLPNIYIEIEITYYLLRRLLGVQIDGDKKAARVQRLEKKEALLLNIGSMSTGGIVLQAKSDVAVVRLQLPVCTEYGEKVALSRRIDKHWRLIGWGQIRRGKIIEPQA